VSGAQAAAHGLDRRPACRGAVRDRLGTGHGNVAYPDRVNRPQ